MPLQVSEHLCKYLKITNGDMPWIRVVWEILKGMVQKEKRSSIGCTIFSLYEIRTKSIQVENLTRDKSML